MLLKLGLKPSKYIYTQHWRAHSRILPAVISIHNEQSVIEYCAYHIISAKMIIFKKLTFNDCFDFGQRGGRSSKKKPDMEEEEFSTLYKDLMSDGTMLFEYFKILEHYSTYCQ